MRLKVIPTAIINNLIVVYLKTMKAEINNENKAKFFAQYYGQKLMTGGAILRIIDATWNWKHNDFHLQLKPLALITDEDAKVIALHARFNGSSEEVAIKIGKDILCRVFEVKDTMMCLPFETGDYLRFKGYALPWMGLSVEEMVGASWIKLTTQQNIFHEIQRTA